MPSPRPSSSSSSSITTSSSPLPLTLTNASQTTLVPSTSSSPSSKSPAAINPPTTLWTKLRQKAIQHHAEVNAAYEAYYRGITPSGRAPRLWSVEEKVYAPGRIWRGLEDEGSVGKRG